MTKPIITLIVAADAQNAIGRAGQLPWHLPQDLKFFKNTTWAMPVIMGRKTFDAVGRPLPGRTNVVITRNSNWSHPDVWVAETLQAAIAMAGQLQTHEIFITGGGQIYREALPLAGRIYLTRVHTSIADADTWFPVLDNDQWQLQWKRPFEADDKHAFAYQFECWERVAVL